MAFTNTSCRCHSVARIVTVNVLLLLSRTRGSGVKVSNFDMVAVDRLLSMRISTTMKSSEADCCGECQKNDKCHALSYYRANGKCVLSDNHWQMTNPSTGWQTFTRRYECPFAGSDTFFHRVGHRTRLAICPSPSSPGEKMTTPHVQAWTACRQFGNLLKLDTQDKMNALKQFLHSIYQKNDAYWVDGRMTSNVWVFTDGTPMPSGMFNWTHTGQTQLADPCAEITTTGSYQLMAAPCNKTSGYICEKSWS